MSLKQVTGRSFVWSIPEDADSLSTTESEMEHAFSEALSFAKLWRLLDSDGSDTIDENELSKIMSKELVSKMMKQIDWNGDNVLTFNELAWMMSQRSLGSSGASNEDLTKDLTKKLSLSDFGAK